jgi:signal transduction histidine kinase
MFDLPARDSGIAENSGMNFNRKGESMIPVKNNLTDCPLVLTGMSHEMHTHMNAIVAFSFLLKDHCTGHSENKEYSAQILNSCEQLIGLFDSFLDTAIIGATNPVNDARICKTDSILDEILPELRDSISKQSNNNVELVTSTWLSNATEVYIDKNKIFRVLRSLSQVSSKSTESGYIKIGYQYNNDDITFYVLDSGQGFLKCKEFLHTEDMNESLLIHNDVPSAINITLARKLIQILGGTIWIESNGLSGTGIYFSVPVQKVTSRNISINKYHNTLIAL